MALTYGDQQVSDNSVPVLVLQALAAGTIIYVSFFEIMERERLKGNNRLMQWLLIVLGFLAILGLEALSTHLFRPDVNSN
jgi:solute carrier family 39 (zinc transporter), member 1/2/3